MFKNFVAEISEKPLIGKFNFKHKASEKTEIKAHKINIKSKNGGKLPKLVHRSVHHF